MAKKPKSDPEQYKRFLQKVKEMEDAGELSPTEADEAMERVMRGLSSFTTELSNCNKDE